MAAVAVEAGISKSALYDCFGSKDALVDALVARLLEGQRHDASCSALVLSGDRPIGDTQPSLDALLDVAGLHIVGEAAQQLDAGAIL